MCVPIKTNWHKAFNSPAKGRIFRHPWDNLSFSITLLCHTISPQCRETQRHPPSLHNRNVSNWKLEKLFLKLAFNPHPLLGDDLGFITHTNDCCPVIYPVFALVINLVQRSPIFLWPLHQTSLLYLFVCLFFKDIKLPISWDLVLVTIFQIAWLYCMLHVMACMYVAQWKHW